MGAKRETKTEERRPSWRHMTPLAWSRRQFLALLGGGGVRAAVGTGTPVDDRSSSVQVNLPGRHTEETCYHPAPKGHTEEYDYIVVGSGAGGGPLAANLARKGHKVLLLEAGGIDEPLNYSVPAFHGLSTEDPALSWQYFVRHYANDEQQQRDPKFTPERNGVFYPRAGTLGGCTAHSAMIIVYPHNSDWDHIAEITGDESWRPHHMRRYFERLEAYRYIDPRVLAEADQARDDDAQFWEEVFNPSPQGLLEAVADRTRSLGNRIKTRLEKLIDSDSRHGSQGWLPTNRASLSLALRDRQLLDIVKSAAKATLQHGLGPITGLLDVNHWKVAQEQREGFLRVPMATDGKNRRGTREYLIQTQKEYWNNLTIQPHTLVTKILFSEDGTHTAIGVEYRKGAHLYKADPSPRQNEDAGEQGWVRAKREVILAAGAFNTPQLLLLSGIGPREELRKLGIQSCVHLPGVGKSLQDRYEVGVISELANHFSILEGTTFTDSAADIAFHDWQRGKGLYTTNGAVLGIVKRSKPERREPDLFIFGVPGHFEGYYPGWSEIATKKYKNRFSWLILKAHTNNRGGIVTLQSNDPRDRPSINFRYFDEGTDRSGEDLASVVEGIKFVRQINTRINQTLPISREVLPGKTVQSDEDLKAFIKNNAWGHHACGTCKMGPPEDQFAVVDSGFRVYGTKNLRVVDASIFPKIPGFFIVTPIYMISEKASDVIHEDAVRQE